VGKDPVSSTINERNRVIAAFTVATYWTISDKNFNLIHTQAGTYTHHIIEKIKK
jgi:hypothetical protein